MQTKCEKVDFLLPLWDVTSSHGIPRRSSHGRADQPGRSGAWRHCCWSAVALLLAAAIFVYWRKVLWKRFGRSAPKQAAAYMAVAAARLRLASSATLPTSVTLDGDTVVFELDRHGHPHVLGAGTFGQVCAIFGQSAR